MTKDNQQIEQAIEAVRRQPGSPAYAFLAERYLDEGNLDEAVRICRAGFAANPGFERGAVAFLAVLRRLGELDTASEVYGRAVAYLPRSARVRMGWALILADVGREREARNLAREALDLDPLNREARAFVATLGGTPAPTLTANASPASTAARGQVSIVSEGKSRAEVRPWVRPIGQRTTPHSMFDLTPTPEILSEQVRKELSIFDLPAPDEEIEERSVEVLVPVDLFEDTGKPEPPVRPVPSGPLHPAATPSSLVRAVPRGSELQSSAARPPPPPLRESPTGPQQLAGRGHAAASPPPLRAVSTGPQPLRPTPTPAASAAPLHLDELEIEPDADPVPVGIPIAPSLDFEADLRDPGSPASRAPTGTLPELQYRPRRRRLRAAALAAVGLALLAGGGTAGYLAYVQRARRAEAARAMARMDPDLLEGYLDARRELQALVQAHPGLRPALGGLALADAHLSTRFGADPALEGEAKRLADQALASGASPPARAALALLALRAGDSKLAAANLAAVPEEERDWHHRLAVVLVALALGEPDRARALLGERGSAAPAAALLLEAAQLHHRTGERGSAATTAARGLAISPRHPGLRLISLLATPSPDAAALDALEPAARAVPRYRTTLALARALAAEHRGALGEARRLVAAAFQSDPKDPHAAAHTARLLGGAGGDLPRAIELLAPHAAAQLPGVRISIAGLLLRAGRPHEGRLLLEGIGTKLAEPDRAMADALLIRAASLAEDATTVDRLCIPRKELAPNRAAIVFCAEARGEQPALIEALARHLPPGPESRYLAGLRALALGDASAAAQLARVDRLEIDPAAPLLALGRARARTGDQNGALAILRKAVLVDAGSARTQVALASLLSSAGSQAEALPLLEAVAKERPTQPSLIAAIGESYLSLGKPARAKALIDSVRAPAGDTVALRLLAGRVALASQHTAEARDHFKAVLLRDAKNADALIELGRIETAAGNGDAARRHFQAALRQRPKDTGLLLAVARAHAHSGNYRKALDSGMSSIRLLKRSGQEAQAYEAMVELGRLLVRGDKWARARAEELFFEASKRKDATAAPFLELGRLYRQQNDLARTVWCFRQAVQRAPSHAEAYLELGMALRAKPQWRRDAKQALRHYLRLRPDGSEAARVRALLARMR